MSLIRSLITIPYLKETPKSFILLHIPQELDVIVAQKSNFFRLRATKTKTSSIFEQNITLLTLKIIITWHDGRKKKLKLLKLIMRF